MKALLLSTFLLFLFSCGQNTTLPPTLPPQPNIYAKQVGICDTDTASFWEYQVYAITPNDTTAYTITQTVIDTATINGQSAYLIRTVYPYGPSTFKQRVDSTGIYTQNGNSVVGHYLYPVTDNGTFLFYADGDCSLYATVLSTDTTITLFNHSFAHCIAYQTLHVDNCNNANKIVFYQYGVGMVVTQLISATSITEWFLLQRD